MISRQAFEKQPALPYQRRMKAHLKTLFASVLLLITMCLGAFAAAPEKHALGDFEITHLHLDQNPAANNLASLENFDYHAKIASECCNATNKGELVGDSFVPRGNGIVKDSTVQLDQNITAANGQTIPAGSIVTESGGAIKVVTPNGVTITGRTDNLVESNQLALPATNRTPDFYVSPDGTAVPGTGVRFSDSQYADHIVANGSSPGTPGGHYFGTETFPSSTSAADAYQISPDWSDVRVQGEFDTLQLYDPQTQTWNIEIPTTNGNTTNILEPYTSAYPEFGTGGVQQYITAPDTPLNYNNITVLPE